MPINLQLGFFLGASLLLHAGVLLHYHGADIRLAAQTEELAGKVLHISLRQEHTPAQQKPETRPATPARHAAAARVSHTPTAIPAPNHAEVESKTRQSEPAITHHNDNNRISRQSSEARAQVLSRVRETFDQHFYYPMLARRHGWQGQVLLGFSVAANGRIHDVHVQRGSGYSLLDESAQSALNRIKQLQQVQHWLGGASMQLQLSVVYRLQGG